MSENLVKVTIDDVELDVPAGTLVIRAAEKAGIRIPRFCDHPLLEPVAACRQCLVEVLDAVNRELVERGGCAGVAELDRVYVRLVLATVTHRESDLDLVDMLGGLSQIAVIVHVRDHVFLDELHVLGGCDLHVRCSFRAPGVLPVR